MTKIDTATDRYAEIDEPLPPGASDDAVERLARDMGMTRNERPSNEPEEEDIAVSPEVEGSAEPQSNDKKVSAVQPKPSKQARITIDLPEYVAKRLKRKALEEDSSVRFLILRAINASRSLRISVDEADMIEDRRRSKKSKR